MPRHAHGHAHAPEPLLAASESARHLPASSSQQPAAARIDTALGPRPLIHERFVEAPDPDPTCQETSRPALPFQHPGRTRAPHPPLQARGQEEKQSQHHRRREQESRDRSAQQRHYEVALALALAPALAVPPRATAPQRHGQQRAAVVDIQVLWAAA